VVKTTSFMCSMFRGELAFVVQRLVTGRCLESGRIEHDASPAGPRTEEKQVTAIRSLVLSHGTNNDRSEVHVVVLSWDVGRYRYE
jgi:hypothetical protein